MQTCVQQKDWSWWEVPPDDWTLFPEDREPCPDNWKIPEIDSIVDFDIPLLPQEQPREPLRAWVPYEGRQELFDLTRMRQQTDAADVPLPPVHRRVLKIPDSLMRLDDFIECPLSPLAGQKSELVKNGHMPFGVSIVLPSFRPPPPVFCDKVPRNLACVYLLYTLFSRQMCDTAQGKVITFPFTVYTNTETMSKRVGGYPVIAVHRTQVTNAVAMMFSAAKKIVDVDTLNKSLGYAQCLYSTEDAAIIHNCAGTRVFTTKARQKTRLAYALFPATWLDSVRGPFFTPDGNLRPITSILAEWFPVWKHRFVEEFECVFLGHQREIRTSTFVRSPKNMIKTPLNCQGANFTFGISCWRELLPAFMSAHRFFTGVEHVQTVHICGLFESKISPARVCSQDDAFARGLCIDDQSYSKSGEEIRRKTHLVKRKHGTDFVCKFFGETKVCYHRKDKKE